MKKIKLITALLCIALLCVFTAGCSTEKTSKTENDTDTAIETAEQSGTEEPEEAKDPAPYTKGQVEGNVYTNTAANLTLRIPQGWRVADDYELSSLMGITYNFEDHDAYLADVAKSSDIFDLFAKDATEDFSIMILFQDLAAYNMDDISASEFLEIQKETLVSETATFEKSEIKEITYSSNTYAMMTVTSVPYEGTPVIQYFFSKEVDGRMMSIIMTSPSSEPITPDTIFA